MLESLFSTAGRGANLSQIYSHVRMSLWSLHVALCAAPPPSALGSDGKAQLTNEMKECTHGYNR